MLWWKFAKLLMSFLEAKVNFPSNFVFNIQCHQTLLVCTFLARTFYMLVIKIQIFEIFECSGRNLPNSSCHFPNGKQVFLQILHDSSVSWKITPLYFFRSKIIYFAQRDQSKCIFWTLLSAQIKIHQVLGNFETINSFFFKFCISIFSIMIHNNSTYYSWNYIYFQQKEATKVQIWWSSPEQLKFSWNCAFWWAPFLKKSCKISAKKVQKSHLSWH